MPLAFTQTAETTETAAVELLCLSLWLTSKFLLLLYTSLYLLHFFSLHIQVSNSGQQSLIYTTPPPAQLLPIVSWKEPGVFSGSFMALLYEPFLCLNWF